MPKTYTDDIAATLPSSLDGPFKVVDPSDAAAYFKVDPAQARVEAAGGARPMRRVNLGFYKTIGTTLAGTIGTAMGSRIVAVGNTGGYLCNAIGVPVDMDLSAPANVKVMLAPDADSSLSGKQVRIELTISYGKGADSALTTTTINHDWTTPDNWSAGDPELVVIDAGNGETFAANTFELDDVIGIWLRLARAAGADTFDQSVHLAAGAVLEYTAKEL